MEQAMQGSSEGTKPGGAGDTVGLAFGKEWFQILSDDIKKHTRTIQEEK